MKELDILLLRYLNGPWAQADAAERNCFEQFLELPDPDILSRRGREQCPKFLDLNRMKPPFLKRNLQNGLEDCKLFHHPPHRCRHRLG
jgi:hypothetical protein